MAQPSYVIWFLRVLWALTRREIAEAARYRVSFVVRLLAFGLTAVSLVFFSRFIGAARNPYLERYGGDYLAFGIVGLLVAELQHVGVSALAQRVRMAQILGFFEAQMATPAPPWIVLGAAPVYEFGVAALRSTAYLIGAMLLFDVQFHVAGALPVIAVVALTLTAFAGLGLVTAATTMITRRSNPVAVILGAASVFLSGVVYPVAVLPAGLQQLGSFLPLTHALEGLRQALLSRASLGDLGSTLLALALFGAILTPLGFLLFAFALRRARVDGSLTHY